MAGRQDRLFFSVKTEGAVLPTDLLQRIVEADPELGGLTPGAYHLAGGEKLTEATSRSWNRLLGAWKTFQTNREKLAVGDPCTKLTREQWLLPLFQELGYGRLLAAKAIEIEGKNYAISHLWNRAPIHLLGCSVDLDRPTPHLAGASRSSPHSLLQELLNRSPNHLWGFVSNGLRLRILRDNASLARQAYVEFDIEAMMQGEIYSDFVLLWLLCHESRVEAERPEECWLEKWSQSAKQRGVRALDQLRQGVETAIKALGSGFLSWPGNRDLRERLRRGDLAAQDYYRQILRLVYRLLFLFAAEDRELLLLSGEGYVGARKRFLEFYSTRCLRRLAERRTGTRHGDLYAALRVVMRKLASDAGYPSLALPALGSFLFSDRALPEIENCDITNRDLLEAVRALAITVMNGVWRSVDYKNLGAEELGSVYESLLELHPRLDLDAAAFDLDTAAGHERKTTGSYYTPTSLVECLLDSALNPVLEEASKKAEPEAAILKLKVVDPACGSGHFLIAAAHRIAKRLASVRTGDEEPSPEALRTALRDVIGHCIYGVDVNPMAVELCKVNLWLEALEPGKPLSFLEHRIQVGNSLLGTTPRLLDFGIPDEAFKPIEGDLKEACAKWRKVNKSERKAREIGAAKFAFDDYPWLRLGNFAQSLMKLDNLGDDTIEGVRAKAKLWEETVRSSDYLDGKFLSDAWCAAFVWKKHSLTDFPITEEVFRRIERNPHSCEPRIREEVQRLASEYNFFHWHLAFPDVFRIPGKSEAPENEHAGWSGGFDLVLGNPPFLNAIEGQTRERVKALTKTLHPHLSGTADSSYLFLDKSTSLIALQGRLGMIQPRPMLNSPAAARMRARLLKDHPPSLLYVPGRSDFFPGVTVFVCLVALGVMHECRISTDPNPETAHWDSGPISHENWWLEINRICGRYAGHGSTGEPLGNIFEITASMTTGEAYEVRPFVLDARDGGGQKLVTTGLIDPGVCKWGRQPCKYLKQEYQFPRVVPDKGMSAALQRRVLQSGRPKVLVAGLSRRIESVLDATGELIGAVSTFSIFDPDNNIDRLGSVHRLLQSDAVDQLFKAELGANAVGGGDTVMRKEFLQHIRMEHSSIGIQV